MEEYKSNFERETEFYKRDQQAQEAEKLESRFRQEREDKIAGTKDGVYYPSASSSQGERRQSAKAFGYLGIVLMAVAVIAKMGYLPIQDIQILGYRADNVALFVGIACLILGYAPMLAAFLFFVAAVALTFGSGLSSQGFSFSQIPSGNWVGGVVFILIGILVIRGLANKRA